MRVSVIGCGYVGLVTGGCLAEIGHHVVCTDNDESKIKTLHAGKVPIYEPHLDGILERNIASGRLSFTSNAADAVNSGDAVFICVGTPPLETGEADLSAIDNCARTIATASRSPKLIVEKSTVPAHTGQQLQRALGIYSRNNTFSFHVASNPEFLREGTAVIDFLYPDRIVVGVEEPLAEQQLREMYRPILERTFVCPLPPSLRPNVGLPRFIVTTINSAELIKHASNSFLALKISYANVLADLCEKIGADVQEVAHAVGLDPRIGPQFLRPGLGFGGFCLPKDVQAFIRLAEKAGVDFSLLKEVERVNKNRIALFMEKVRRALWTLKDKQVAVLGLAFKPNTDDIRFAPAIDLVHCLQSEGARVHAYDPEAMERARPLLPGVTFAKNAYETTEGADAVLIVTEWDEFRGLDWQRVRSAMARPLMLDGRNLFDPLTMRALSFEYHSVGRPD